MKQYKSFSLALLLSTPAFAMQVHLPTQIHDSSGSPEEPTAFIGFHTFADEEKVPVIKASEESILKQLAARTAHYDEVATSTTESTAKKMIAKDKSTESIIVHAVKECSDLAEEEAAAARAQTQAKNMEYRAAKLTEAVEAGNLLEKADGYESDTEKGLSKENIQLYRFNKYVNAATQTLTAAQPSLMDWFKNPENDKTVEKLPELSKKLEDQTNRIEVWLKQIGSYSAIHTAAYSKLRNTIKAFENSFDAAIGENQEKFKTRLVGNFSHPATIFLNNFEALQELVNKNS